MSTHFCGARNASWMFTHKSFYFSIPLGKFLKVT